MKYTRARAYANMVMLFLYNIHFGLIDNLALRNKIGVLAFSNSNEMEYFGEMGIISGFIITNIVQLQDIKWFVFLNGPIFIVSLFFHALFWGDETFKNNPDLDY